MPLPPPPLFLSPASLLHHGPGDVLSAQDISGGQPVQLEGTDLPVWGMEIDPDKAKQQFRSYSASDKGSKVGMIRAGTHTHSSLPYQIELSELVWCLM